MGNDFETWWRSQPSYRDSDKESAKRGWEARGARIVELEAELEAVKFVPGMLRCAKCNFERVWKSVNVHSGTITTGTSGPLRCPNGCGPLWKVSLRDCADRHFEDACKLAQEVRDLKKLIKSITH